MSRIGRQPIPVPAGVSVTIEPESVRVNGPKGELSERVHRDMEVVQEGEQLLVSRPTDRGEHRALHGLTRTLVANMVQGVTAGYEKRLEIQGVGYRAQLKGKNLELAVGYSHPVPIAAPGGDRVRGAPAHEDRGEGHLQAARGGDRRDHPQAAPPGAVQGQGHPLRGRVRGPEGREEGMTLLTKPERRLKRRRRVRAKIAGTATRPRISVFRSNKGLSAQAIDDVTGRTLAAVNWYEPELGTLAKGERTARAGALLAERVKAAGVSEAVFDRGGYLYHGHVRAFAEALREAGITV